MASGSRKHERPRPTLPAENPLLIPKKLKPSRDRLQVTSLLNPGLFTFQNKTWLLVRVAESAAQKDGVLYFGDQCDW